MSSPVPRFSFLTTAYQTENYISRTIESVLEQTYGDLELVVVDNGNSDAMAAIVERYARLDHRVRLIRQENRGYRGGVMAAADAATGSYLCVLDSDDQLLPGFCARIAEVLDAEPSVDAVCIDAYRFRESGDVDLPMSYMRSIGVTATADSTRRLTITDVLGGRVPYYTAAIRREAWDSVGGYEPGVEDADESVIIWCRLADRFDVRMLPDRLARYHVREDSLSRDPAKVEAFERQLILSFEHGAISGDSLEHRRALDRTVRGLRYHQEIRRARYALLGGDVVASRLSARAAFAQRRTVRAAVILTGLTVAPGVMRRLHPAKRRITFSVSKTVGRVALLWRQ